MKNLIYRVKVWIRNPSEYYPGYHCGCCGTWVEEPFEVPYRKSCGRWWDTIGICKECSERGTGVGRWE